MLETKVTLYEKESIDKLPWPDSEHGQKTQKIIKPLVTFGTKKYFENIDTKMLALMVEDKILPVTVCEASQENSYVCSPYCHYVTYGREEIKNFSNKPLKFLLGNFLSLFGKFLNFCHIDKNVIVNNWLVPTNLYPNLTKAQLKAITEKLILQYPNHAIMFRSINPEEPKGLFDNLKSLGYSLVMSREVYYTTPQDDKPFKSRMFKSDMKILKQSAYCPTYDIRTLEKAIPRIKELYRALNIEKYSKCNPQYTENFIKLALESGWMTFKAFEKNGNIDAVLGYFSNGEVMTSPFFGYDLSLPSETGLYRQISTQLLLDAKEKNQFLHQSSGAGQYKKLRRAKDTLEYTAVYHKHLSPRRRYCWKTLEKLMNTVGKKFIKGASK